MARTRTLAQIRADVCLRADVTDSGASAGRFTTVILNRYVNQAIQEFQRLVNSTGMLNYVKQVTASTSTSSTVDANNLAPRDYLALPSDFVDLVGIDITSGGATVAMQPYMFDERNEFRSQLIFANGGIGMPVFYQLGGMNAANAKVVRIIPSADAVYSCVIWYLGTPTDLASDGDTFDGIAGFEDWVTNRAAMYCLSRDVATVAYKTIAMENAQLQDRMLFEFAKMSGPQRRVDTRGARRRLSRYPRGFWRGP